MESKNKKTEGNIWWIILLLLIYLFINMLNNVKPGDIGKYYDIPFHVEDKIKILKN